MIKKLGMAIAAFAIGLFVSLSIQACAEKIDTGTTKTPTTDAHKFDAWKQPGLEYEEIHYTGGLSESYCRYDYQYDDNGWIIKKTYSEYHNDVLTHSNTFTYTYSDSGEIQYCTYDNGETHVCKLYIE